MNFSFKTYDESGDLMKKWLLSILFCLFLYILFMGNVSVEFTKNALCIWFEKLVPSLFIGMVFIRFLYDQGFFVFLLSPFSYIIQHVFHMDVHSFSLVVSNLLLGFPTGAVLLDEQAKHNQMPLHGIKRILYTCSFATPGFILLTCGSVLYGSITIGFQLMAIQWFCGILFLLVTRNQPVYANYSSTKQIPSFLSSLTSAILESGKTLYMIGGYLMLFMTICSLLLKISPAYIALPLSIFSEFSNGVITIHAQTWILSTKLIITSMLLGFGGLCVHMQVRGMTSHIQYSYLVYFLWRCVQMLLCGLFAYFIFS